MPINIKGLLWRRSNIWAASIKVLPFIEVYESSLEAWQTKIVSPKPFGYHIPQISNSITKGPITTQFLLGFISVHYFNRNLVVYRNKFNNRSQMRNCGIHIWICRIKWGLWPLFGTPMEQDLTSVKALDSY